MVPKVESCRENFKAQELGNTLYGMQGMSSDDIEVRAILTALVPRITSCRETLDVQGNSGYGCSHVVRSLVCSACQFIIFY
jgi:hypothetical protein